ncbi:MAG TPA: FAD-dependent oxidoreductase [Phycisphaerae bacterium]|nr:FAD-dependent oxidoreductase [Phycisphaerae bacterium]
MAEQTPKAWRCTVCGYVHRGAEPPDWCPVCGAAKSEFEPHAEPAAPAAAPAPARRQCLNCNYVHEGPTPPDECPVCGAPGDRFRPLAEQPAAPGAAGEAIEVVIVGAGIAGVSAAEAVRSASPDAKITLISKEQALPYYRLNLTRYLAGEIGPDDLPIHPESWYADHRVELLHEAEVAAVAPDAQTVALRDGREIPFGKLILTIGAHPFIPPFPGSQREGVSSLRTADDAGAILARLRPGMACVCIGGGLLGMETAGALARRGAEVTLLEGHDWPMPRQLNRKAGDLLAAHVGGIGIKLRTNARTKEIVGDEAVAGVLLEDGDTVSADLVVIATGVRPNSHLARRAGLAVHHGVVVDNYLVSSHPNVLAAGDVAEHNGALYGTWGPSQYQGNIAGRNAAGAGVEFGGIPRSNTLKVLGLDLLSIGQFEPEDGSFDVIEEQSGGRYYRFVFHDGRLVGSILLGDTSLSAPLRMAIETGTDLSGLLRRRPTADTVAEHLAKTAER